MSELPQAGRPSHRLVQRFAALCEKAPVAPTVSRFLAAYPNATRRQRVDVMLVDIVRRWSNGHCITVEEYLADDQDLAADRDLSLELIVAEFDVRTQLGLRPGVDEYLQRFAGLKEAISKVLSMRTEKDSPPPCSAFMRHVLEDGLMPGTVWAGKLGNSTGFGINPRAQSHDLRLCDSILSDCRPFSMLAEPVMRLLEANMDVQNFDVGEFLMQQDAPGSSLMVLCEGEVEISTTDEQGNRRVLTRTAELQVLGEMALLTNSPRNANVVAVTPVRTLVLPAEKFHDMAARYPEISEVLTLLLAERLGMPGRDDVLAGKTLDQYRICNRLGRGGMAVVYEARHTDTDRHVALKMMSHRLVYDQEALDQFQAEADTIESFDHANIVKLFGRFAAFHTYFLVMEFADGISLSEQINHRGAMPVEEFRKAFGQIASALRFAHDAGVIHRDVKPANIMLTRDGLIKLMDFGLATPALSNTASFGRVVGTPRYMAPEQLVGGHLTTAADLFALGCVGFEMLTGEPLNYEDNVIELLRRHSNWEVPDIHKTHPHLPADLCRVVEGCLHDNPDDRALDFDAVTAWAGPLETSRLGET